ASVGHFAGFRPRSGFRLAPVVGVDDERVVAVQRAPSVEVGRGQAESAGSPDERPRQEVEQNEGCYGTNTEFQDPHLAERECRRTDRSSPECQRDDSPKLLRGWGCHKVTPLGDISGAATGWPADEATPRFPMPLEAPDDGRRLRTRSRRARSVCSNGG